MAFDMSFFHLAHARTNEDDSEASQKENESLSLQEILTEDPEPTSPSFNRPSQSFTRGGSSRQTPYSSRQHSRAPSGSVATSFASDDSPGSPGSLTARQRVNSFRESKSFARVCCYFCTSHCTSAPAHGVGWFGDRRTWRDRAKADVEGRSCLSACMPSGADLNRKRSIGYSDAMIRLEMVGIGCVCSIC